MKTKSTPKTKTAPTAPAPILPKPPAGKSSNRVFNLSAREWRELLDATRNEHGDLVLTVDGGERWQFTPCCDMPPGATPIERIRYCGRGVDSKTRLPSPLAFLVLENPKEHFVGNFRILPPDPEAGKRLMLDGENCEITSRKWEAEDSPEIVTRNGVELPVTTVKRYIIDFTIRKPDGTAIRLVVHPPFLPLQARMNPLEVESITPVMMAAGLGGRDEIPYNALVHFAEQSAPRRCYVERLPVEGEAPAAAPEMMSIAEAAKYARRTERTIRSWLKKETGDGPMLPGVIWKGKIPRIPRTSLDPWRK